MKGKNQFTQLQANQIRSLLDKKNMQQGKDWQKPIRDQLRDMGFYISDFGGYDFTSQDFDFLIRTGRIKIVDSV